VNQSVVPSSPRTVRGVAFPVAPVRGALQVEAIEPISTQIFRLPALMVAM
jgi:hypothetical protein